MGVNILFALNFIKFMNVRKITANLLPCIPHKLQQDNVIVNKKKLDGVDDLANAHVCEWGNFNLWCSSVNYIIA